MPKDERNKRVAPRYPVLGHAQIIGQTKAINCVVRDLSDTGAKLGVSNSVKLPAEFDLRFVQRRLTLRVRVRWRAGEYVGVAFCDSQLSHVSQMHQPRDHDAIARVGSMAGVLTL